MYDEDDGWFKHQQAFDSHQVCTTCEDVLGKKTKNRKTGVQHIRKIPIRKCTKGKVTNSLTMIAESGGSEKHMAANREENK